MQLSLSPEIGWRARIAKNRKAELRKSNELATWSLMSGDYSRCPFRGFSIKTRHSAEELIGVENYIYQTALQFLVREETDDSPLIFLDFGGMFGLSFVRVAAALERMQFISQGKIILIISNLQFQPGQEDPDWTKKFVMNQTDKNYQFFRENNNLVRYLQADASELYQGRKNFALPLSLQGNIQLIHEMNALMHGHKNDVDLPLLANLLSNDGKLLLGSRNLEHKSSESRAYRLLRDDGHKRGKQNVEAMGYLCATSDQDGYSIFSS